MPEIRVESLRKAYGAHVVIENLDLSMGDGEFTVFVGPSGCGKSTTLRLIAGLEAVSGGTITIGGRDVTHVEPKDRDLAMVFQDYALYPHMNVAKNMSFALRLAGYPRVEIERRVREAAATLDLTPYLHRKPAELSGGQRQRVAMGRALVRDAGVFLFDEPLSNLDAKLRAQMRQELALMSQRIRKNMIYVTHDQVEAMTLGHRIVVMRSGEIMQVGTPEELYRRPANKFVAGFIGSPSMNFIPGEVRDEGGEIVLQGEGFRLVPPAETRARLAQAKGRQVEIGVRPSAFTPAQGPDVVTLPVLLAEYVGAQSILVARLGGARIAIEVKSNEPLRAGGEMSFAINADEMRLFDPRTGAVI
jgi:multiple sugar transport system ATP-binding protein